MSKRVGHVRAADERSGEDGAESDLVANDAVLASCIGRLPEQIASKQETRADFIRIESANQVVPLERRILAHAPSDLSVREAFVRLISGNGDWDAAATLVAREHARWVDGIRAGRAGAVPGVDLLRVSLARRLTGLD